MFALRDVVEVGDFEDGGGFPVRFLQLAYRTLGVTDPARVLHICSGSVRGPFTVDRRASVRPAVVADARALPFAAGSFDWALADPPYSRQWARTLYGITARQYPTPGGIVREALRVLRPGGRLGLLHYMVPPYSTDVARLVGVWGITLGPGSTIRAYTVLERVASSAPELPWGGPPYGGQVPHDRVRDPQPESVTKGPAPYVVDHVQPEVSSRPCACGCGRLVEQLASTGRPRLYWSPGCRQRVYRQRGRGDGDTAIS